MRNYFLDWNNLFAFFGQPEFMFSCGDLESLKCTTRSKTMRSGNNPFFWVNCPSTLVVKRVKTLLLNWHQVMNFTSSSYPSTNYPSIECGVFIWKVTSVWARSRLKLRIRVPAEPLLLIPRPTFKPQTANRASKALKRPLIRPESNKRHN